MSYIGYYGSVEPLMYVIYTFTHSYVREDMAVFIMNIKIIIYMSYKEQMEKWLCAHPDATAEEAYEAGYMQSNVNWCHGKMESLTKLKELIIKILE